MLFENWILDSWTSHMMFYHLITGHLKIQISDVHSFQILKIADYEAAIYSLRNRLLEMPSGKFELTPFCHTFRPQVLWKSEPHCT